MERWRASNGYFKKKQGGSGRTLTEGLLYLRCVQMGMTIADTDLLTIGEIYDMIIETSNERDGDNVRNATQADFDAFKRM